ncbi:MAG TPA: hypothetical protein VG324_20005 [Blastocatellia bacterium]|nr:hypothetical protein [Blastocatellia bacterium]
MNLYLVRETLILDDAIEARKKAPDSLHPAEKMMRHERPKLNSYGAARLMRLVSL